MKTGNTGQEVRQGSLGGFPHERLRSRNVSVRKECPKGLGDTRKVEGKKPSLEKREIIIKI